MTVSGWIWTEIESEEAPEPLLIICAERRGERPERPADDTEGMAGIKDTGQHLEARRGRIKT
jgi:hypothetical protein